MEEGYKWSTGTAEVNGKTYERAISANTCGEDYMDFGRFNSYNLGRKYQVFRQLSAMARNLEQAC